MPDLQQCGPAGFLLTFLGVTGFVASLFAIVLAILDPRVSGRATLARTARVVGPMTALLGVAAIGVGVATTVHGRRAVDALLASGSVPQADVERTRALGYAQVGACTAVGIQSGSMPLLAGIIATVIAVRRRNAARPAA